MRQCRLSQRSSFISPPLDSLDMRGSCISVILECSFVIQCIKSDGDCGSLWLKYKGILWNLDLFPRRMFLARLRIQSRSQNVRSQRVPGRLVEIGHLVSQSALFVCAVAVHNLVKLETTKEDRLGRLHIVADTLKPRPVFKMFLRQTGQMVGTLERLGCPVKRIVLLGCLSDRRMRNGCRHVLFTATPI
jgi:hypothetical protein